MREFSDLKPFFDIPDSFCFVVDSLKTLTASGGGPLPSETPHDLLLKSVGGPNTVIQKSKQGNKRFYCIVTGRVTLFVSPFAFCAVTVILFSPVGSGLVK